MNKEFIKKIGLKLYYEPRWKKLNKHNFTKLDSVFNFNNVNIGIGTYGSLRIINNDNFKLKIGNYCSVADDVTFLVGFDHKYNSESLFPFDGSSLDSNELKTIANGDIIIDDDVWIGYGATILPNVHIGQGAVVAAGALVCKDVPPYAIVGGKPSMIIKYRFNDVLIKELLKIDFSKLTKEDIINHEKDLYKELINLNQLDWLPRKQK